MLKKLLGGKKKPPVGSPVIAMVVLNDAASADPARLKEALQAVASGPVEVDQTKGLVITIPLDGPFALISLMPGPIPWSDLGPACAASWMWPDAADTLRGCKAHLVVIVMGPANPIQANVLLTLVTAAAAEATDAPGVYWGSAGMVHDGAEFAEEGAVASPDDLPVLLWVRMNLSVQDGLCDGSTLGMEPLGHMEFEVHASKHTPEEVGEIMTMAASYVLDQGPVLKHRQTFGRSAAEKISILHGPSKWDKDRRVIVLGY